MKITISSNIKQVQDAMAKAAGQVPFAMMTAINKTALQAKSEIQTQMKQVFDRPTPWVINSIGPRRREDFATKTNLSAEVAFRDKWQGSNDRTMVSPHVEGGKRHFKSMEARLWRAGLLPDGYNAVPGAAAKIDANGNMSPGQISQLLNVLGTYTEAGYNKANDKTVKRLAKGNVKKNVNGFVYWVNKVGSTGQGRHLQPGVYQRVKTAFGSSLKPVLIFVKRAAYKQRLDFYGIAKSAVERDLPGNFDVAFDAAMRTALLKNQGSLL